MDDYTKLFLQPVALRSQATVQAEALTEPQKMYDLSAQLADALRS